MLAAFAKVPVEFKVAKFRDETRLSILSNKISDPIEVPIVPVKVTAQKFPPGISIFAVWVIGPSVTVRLNVPVEAIPMPVVEGRLVPVSVELL